MRNEQLLKGKGNLSRIMVILLMGAGGVKNVKNEEAKGKIFWVLNS